MCTSFFTGTPGNDLSPSIRAAGLDRESLLQADESAMDIGSCRVKPGRAGQGVGTIADTPPVDQVVAQLAQEYTAAHERLGAATYSAA